MTPEPDGDRRAEVIPLPTVSPGPEPAAEDPGDVPAGDLPVGTVAARPDDAPVPADDTADEVVDAELVDDPAPATPPRPPRRVWLVQAVRLSPVLPAELRAQPDARSAARYLGMLAVVAPLVRYPRAVGRGAYLAGRAWWRWLRVTDLYDSAVADGKLHDRWRDLSYDRKVRRIITVVVAALLALAVSLAVALLAGWVLALVVFVLADGLAVAGRRRDKAGGRGAALGPRSVSWTLDPTMLDDRFAEAGLLKRTATTAERLHQVQRPHRVADGWAVVVDLPGTRKASDAVAKREALASSFAVDETQLVVERVRGRDGHAGRVSLWVADEDPFARPAVRSPLAEATGWDFWRPAPFGTTARGARVDLPLVWSSLLVGGLPRMGKSVAGRLPATAAALDPHVRVVVADGKGGRDWTAFRSVAHRFLLGDESETVERLVAVLEELCAETRRRFAVMQDLDDATCPEGKVTAAMTRNPAMGMPLVLAVVDELQNYTEHETHGKRIVDQLTYLARKAPAAGIMLLLLTQKPDSRAIPTRLRDVVGTRFALRCTTWQASESVLGGGKYAEGYDASKFLPRHKGVGWLIGADGETELSHGDGLTVRAHLLDLSEVRAACERGRVLREQAGTLTGDAAGDDADLPAVVLDRPVAELDAAVTPELPTTLASVVEHLADDLDDDGRAFVPTDELAAALGATGRAAAARMVNDLREVGVVPRPTWVEGDDGRRRQRRGFRTADVNAAVAAISRGDDPAEGVT